MRPEARHSRTVAILLGALALLTVVTLVAERATQARRKALLGGGVLLADLDLATVTRLELRCGQRTTVVVRDLDRQGWSVLPSARPADPQAVSDALEALAALDRRELRARNPEHHARLEVDDGNPSACEVRLFQGKDGAAPSHHLIIGKAGSDPTTSFVRVAGEVEVYLGPGELRGRLDRGRRGFSDLTLLEFDATRARRLELVNGDAQVVLERRSMDGGGIDWQLTAPEAADADDATVETILFTLAHLGGDEEADPAYAAATGLDPPAASARITLDDGTTLEVALGHEREGQVFARGPRGDVVLIAAYRRGSIFRPVEDLRAETNLDPGAGEESAADQ